MESSKLVDGGEGGHEIGGGIKIRVLVPTKIMRRKFV
jgi:hypothetical protein